MTGEKIAGSLPGESLAAELREGTLAGLVAQMRAEDGVPSAEDDAWADRALGLA